MQVREMTAAQYASQIATGGDKKRVLIVGAGEEGRRIAKTLMNGQGGQYHVIGFVDDRPMVSMPQEVSILGKREDIPDLVARYGVNEIVISSPPTWQQILAESMADTSNADVKVRVVPGVYEAMLGCRKLEHIDDIPLIPLGYPVPSRGYLLAKRTMDVVLSAVALVVAFPIMLPAVLAVKLGSPGPAIYSQERIGRNGRPFTILKLRTMVQDAEAKTGPTLSDPGDRRVTRIGRILRATKLDEFPQFLNVLRGDMSLVGPRPERPAFVSKYSELIPCYTERHRVLPGITGLAQVEGYYETSADTKLKYDLLYVYNQSILQDIMILLRTFGTIFRGLRG